MGGMHMEQKPLVVVNGLVRKDAIAYLKEHVESAPMDWKDCNASWDIKGMARWCGWFVVCSSFRCRWWSCKNAPNLKVIAQAAVGYDNVKIDELTAAGIPYGNTPGVLNETVAELAFTLIATASRRILEMLIS